MNIKICITSHHSFSNQTFPIIVPSLISSGIESKNIFFIEGGHTSRSIDITDNINYIKTNHNSIEYTGLIDIAEYSMESDYWIMLHDTCRVGKNFKSLIQNIPHGSDKVALKRWPSMSIGAYKYTYLKKQCDRLMNIKNTDYSREKIQYWKQWGIYNEDYMLWKEHTTDCALYNEHLELSDKFIVVDEQPWYYSKIKRRIEYYPQLDLYKNKANWQPKEWMEIDV
jgi:hypothetical protein